jgi:hypothetical protein
LLKDLLETAVKLEQIPADGKIYFNSAKPYKNADGEIIFRNEKTIPRPTIYGLWKRYNLSRMQFIDSLLRLEKLLYKKYSNFPLERTYIPFGYYVYQAKKDGLNPVLNDINEMRTAALHGQVPFSWIRMKGNIIDFFGQGNKYIKEITKEILMGKNGEEWTLF